MSRDIRSFFVSKQPQKLPEDIDIIPESPDLQIKRKRKESRKKRVLNDDSDEEVLLSKNKKTKPNSEKISKDRTSHKSNLKEVKAIDVFGSSKIRRTDPIVKKSERKTEVGIHDVDFEKYLLDIDEKDIDISKHDNASNSNSEQEKNPISTKKHKYDNQPHASLKYVQEVKSPPINKRDERNSGILIENKDLNLEKGTTHNNMMLKNRKSKYEGIDSPEKKTENNYKDITKRTKLNNTDPDDKNNFSINKKHDFSEFTDSDISTTEEHITKTQNKKYNKRINESVLTDEERHERKLHSAALYQKYLNRSGPKHLGAKQIPEGTCDCLKDCSFLLTGVLDSFEKEELSEVIIKYGGCVKSSISKKVTHLLAGEDAGPVKMAKAKELGIKIINEDEFLQLIKDRSKDPINKSDINDKEQKYKSPQAKKSIDKRRNSPQKVKSIKKCPEIINMNCNKEMINTDIHLNKSKETIKTEQKVNKDSEKTKSCNSGDIGKAKSENEIKLKDKSKSYEYKEKKVYDVQNDANIQLDSNISIMWVDKYKPRNLKQIIGQHGEATNVKKLTNWLASWYMNRRKNTPRPNPWAKNDDGAYYKAVLLSGPPGVGKTTTVNLVCKELGFDTVEFNASDTRNKTLIKEQIGELLSTTSLSAYANGASGKQAVTKKHALIMDEVDGMAGNEDRGGLQELIALIKSTSVPIICMCNDRNSQKMRTLVNYCYDLKFNRPRVDQIKSAMLSICFKEGVKIPPETLSQLIVAANQDVRQTLNLLSMWAIDPHLADTERLKSDVKNVKKDVRLGPWEAVRKVFTAEEHKNMNINDKSDLFFYDYSLAPLFVQENYLGVSPHCPKDELLLRVSNAADNLSMGDIVEARIRGSQAWSLLPIQAMYSSVLPGHWMAGHVASQIQFPGWLGKNSRASKMQRLCQEIHAHTRLSTSGSKSSIFLDYCLHLRDAIVNPLIRDKSDGVGKSMEVLEAYHLMKDDLESLVELSLWPGQRNPTVLIDSKVKSTLTRTYNKLAPSLPYAAGSIKKLARKNEEYNGESEEENDDDEDDPEKDTFIKKNNKKHKDADKPSSSKIKAKNSQGKVKKK